MGARVLDTRAPRRHTTGKLSNSLSSSAQPPKSRQPRWTGAVGGSSHGATPAKHTWMRPMLRIYLHYRFPTCFTSISRDFLPILSLRTYSRRIFTRTSFGGVALTLNLMAILTIHFLLLLAPPAGCLHCELVRIFFCRLIGKQTAFCSFRRVQELCIRNTTRTSFNSAAMLSTASSNVRLATSSPRPQSYVSTSTSMALL